MSLLEYTVNYIHENTGTSDIYSKKSLNFNGTNVVEVKLQYGDSQMIEYSFIHGKRFTTFTFAQKGTISSDFQKEINTVMHSIKDISK